MKKGIKVSMYIKNHASTVYRTDNAGADLSGLGLGDDTSLQNSGSTTPASATLPAGTSTETEEQKTTRLANEQSAATKLTADTEIAKKFGGSKLDDKGNVIDETGKIIKTADEIKLANAPVSVEIDGVNYQLDKDGNAIKDGKIIKTKTEIDALVDIDNEIPLVDEIQQKSGYTLLDDKGQPKKYEDTPEGLLTLANDISDEKYKAGLKKFFDTYPDIEDFAKHIQKGGSKLDYFKQQTASWSNIKFDDKDETLLTNIVVTDLMATGMSKEQAESTAKLYKDTDNLKGYGKDAYTRLVGAEKTKQAAIDKDFNDKMIAQQQQIDNHWKNVNTIIKKGTLNNITIPEVDRDAFFAYIAFDADGHGNSKSVIEDKTNPIELQLQLDYLKFKKFDLKTLITNAVKSEQANTLRKRTRMGQSGVGGGEGIDKDKFVKSADSNISIDNLY